MDRFCLCLALLLSLTGCRLPGSTAPVVKLGLLAPFEGRVRAVGYHLLPAARLAVSEAGLGTLRIEWVILDTGGVPEIAAQRARELVQDPDVVAVIGPEAPESVAAVAPIVAAAKRSFWPLVPGQLPAEVPRPLISAPGEAMALALTAPPGGDWFYLDAPPPSTDFADRYRAATGAEPWPLDAAAYLATQAALATLLCGGGSDCQHEGPAPTFTLYQGVGGQFPGRPLRPLQP